MKIFSFKGYRQSVFCSFFCITAINLLSSVAWGQQAITVQGKIYDNLSSLPGVNVTVKGTTVQTISNYDGSYTIKTTTKDTLVFSMMGYAKKEIAILGRNTINVSMVEEATSLQEVKINAGYYSVKEKERTGSIARMTSKNIEKQPVTNVLAVMQGLMAGVSVTQTTGVAGGGFDIQIRGINSLRANGNQPLYVIDGVPYSSDPIGTGITSPVLPTQPSPLNSINPDQIESIEILKDADATAIYGSRGANGVVLITTKKGKQGKTRFSANVSSGVGTVTKFVDLMNTEQYLQMRREAFTNDGISPYPPYAYDVNGTWDQIRYTNWQEELLGKNASFTNAQASVSGGSTATQFLVSASYNKQTTVFPGDFGYKKGNVHVSLNHESENKRFKINFSTGYTAQNNNQPGTDPTLTALSLAPNAPALYDSEGNLNWENSTWNNPLADFKAVYTAKTYDLIANTLMSYKLTNSLELKSSFGFTDLKNNDTNISPSSRYDPAYGLGSEYSTLFTSQATRKSWIIEPQLNWSKQFSSAKLDVLVGTTFQSQKGNQLVQLGIGFPSNSLIYNLASASRLYTIGSDESVYKYQAFFGRINYNWKDRYIINITGRRDGSSRFGPGKQYANFGAIGGAWLFSEENFLNGNSLLSFGKLRASYGITGNDQIGDYQYLDTYASTGAIYQGTIGLEPTRLFNPDFGWETNKKFEIALETGFLNDRFFVTTAWYNNRSSNQLVGIPLPGTTGFTSLQANLDATVQNRGLELSLRTVNFQNKNFGWTTNINFTQASNKLLSFPDLENSTYNYQFVIGQPLNIKKVYHFTGVNPQTGLYEFEDVNGDGVISAQDDKQFIRDFNPKFFGGVQNQFRYKQLQLDFLFQFVKQLNWSPVVNTSVPGTMSNQPAEVVNHWQSPSNTGAYQLYTDGANGQAVDAFYRYVESDAAVVDASYIRLKNISLSWDVPDSLLKGMKCRVYIQGQNLLTFTSYNGADPEFKASGYLPPLKVWTTGLQFSF
ncbi:SusC/RagA family TonB-linked outer membrane protein [Flavobacterium luminosum]|uniref:SusC/RagA family TonB-linked outer membrane protein n=1 Tax=Flavobacterium luminosum TaxID=2949086 RepID=A0ABT0TQU3_9FLAO|nr:SusC/RagA family TonB-linked outer membrane protein [Flavobacterium sp. HXWNR70]MCL9809858.1 SusC/RagA family TonB-linked outer membrane protein [Flavobacterium sp. HXWNR70]